MEYHVQQSQMDKHVMISIHQIWVTICENAYFDPLVLSCSPILNITFKLLLLLYNY